MRGLLREDYITFGILVQRPNGHRKITNAVWSGNIENRLGKSNCSKQKIGNLPWSGGIAARFLSRFLRGDFQVRRNNYLNLCSQ
ncbi:hypothetical protein B9Z55_022964 [Caenorhabditis nigoni]|uniref:Uncharacterized protein n=1 Tax=Caenorhabditis nigoni TaxID=1611254 RepID=A0A2G5SMR3_9PELO|nr:hypothetical protein B9Z55_022964 [Caenorhabditis nigoni]